MSERTRATRKTNVSRELHREVHWKRSDIEWSNVVALCQASGQCVGLKYRRRKISRNGIAGCSLSENLDCIMPADADRLAAATGSLKLVPLVTGMGWPDDDISRVRRRAATCKVNGPLETRALFNFFFSDTQNFYPILSHPTYSTHQKFHHNTALN